MPDPRDILSRALPTPAPPDLEAIRSRSAALTRRRRSAEAAGLAGVVAAAAVLTTVAIGSLRAGGERDGLIGPATAAPSAASPAASATADPGGSAQLRSPEAQRLARTDEFGAVVRLEEPAGGSLQVAVDRVDWLQGDDAQRAAAERGEEAFGDYYVVNDNPRLRPYEVASDATVHGSIRLTGTPELSEVPLETWLAYLRRATPAELASTYFHLQVEGGRVVAVEEQYRP